jgi:hypothetical protein
MNDLFNFLAPWVRWARNLTSRVNLKRLKRGEYGNAAMYREWRLLQEQQDDNRDGKFGRASFSYVRS